MADSISQFQQFAAQFAKLQKEILDTLQQQQTVLQGQLATAEGIKKAVSGGSSATDSAKNALDLANSFREMGKEVDDTYNTITDTLRSAGDQLLNQGDLIGAASTLLKGMGKFVPTRLFTGFFAVASKGFTLIKELGSSFVGIMKQAGSSIYRMSAAIISIPFSIFSNMIKLSNEQAKAWKHVTEAYESFRGELGNLENVAGKALGGALEGARNGMGIISGLNFHSVFTDSADAINYFSKQFSGMGSLIDTFGPEIQALGAEFVTLTKGMGLSGEQTKSLAMLSKSMGNTLGDTLNEVSAYATQMEKAFNVSSKQIAQDLTKMVSNVKDFGNNTIETLTTAAMRARSLGLEVEVLGKLSDKFLNFEDAAKSASMLSQSFGVNLDTLQLMNGAAKGGGKVLDQLRNSMFSAGRDASKMSTAELRLLASTSGLSEEEARLAFSMKNRGKSMEDIRKQAKKADPQERMNETLAMMADNIQRIVRVFEHESFFDTFISGFQNGIKVSGPFMTMLSNLHKSLDLVHFAGMTIGKTFMRAFPGVEKFAEGFNQLFDPAKYEKFKASIEAVFTTLFFGLGSGANFDEVANGFWTGLKTSFGILDKKVNKKGELVDFAEGEAGPYTTMYNALIESGDKVVGFIKSSANIMFKALKFAFNSLYEKAKPEVVRFVQSIPDIISNNSKKSSSMMASMSKFTSSMWNSLKKSIEGFQNNSELQQSLRDTGYAIVDSLFKSIISSGKSVTKMLGELNSYLFSDEMIVFMSKKASEVGSKIITGLFNAFTAENESGDNLFMTYLEAALLQTLTLLETSVGLIAVAGTLALSLMDGMKDALFNNLYDKVFSPVILKFTEFGTDLVAGLLKGMSGMKKGFMATFSTSVDGIKSFLGIASPSKMFERDIGQNIGLGVTKGLSSTLMDAPSIISGAIDSESIMNSVLGSSASAISNVLADVSSINKSLGDIPDLDVPINLEKIGKVLGIKDNKLKIETPGVNLTLNLTVTLESDKLASVLLETNKIMPK